MHHHEQSHGLLFPMETPKNYYGSLIFFIEENDKGKLDEQYEMEASKYTEGAVAHNENPLLLIIQKTSDKCYELKYKDFVVQFKAKKEKEKYVGNLKGPKNQLWFLETYTDCDELLVKHKIVLSGYADRPSEDDEN